MLIVAWVMSAFLKAVESPEVQQPDRQDNQIVSARAIGREVIVLASRGNAYDAAFELLIEHPADAMVVGNFTFRNRNKIMALAGQYKIPAIYPSRSYAVAGGLMSYGAAIPEVFRLIGSYTGRILKGEKAS
jgi:putative tryptophan/tyrosine transport system substrate-binding protein